MMEINEKNFRDNGLSKHKANLKGEGEKEEKEEVHQEIKEEELDI